MAVVLSTLRVFPQNIITFAGGGAASTAAPYGDGGPASAASLLGASQIAKDADGNYYIADTFHMAIRKVTPAGIISTFAGGAAPGLPVEGGKAATTATGPVAGVAVIDNALYFSCGYNAIRKIDLATTIITTVAGSAQFNISSILGGYSGDGGPALQATMNMPGRLATNGKNLLYFDDFLNSRIRVIDVVAGTIKTAVGNGTQTTITRQGANGIDARSYPFLSLSPPFHGGPSREFVSCRWASSDSKGGRGHQHN